MTRRSAWLKKSGPFWCESNSDGSLTVYPSWLQYGEPWERKEGGGPGFISRMGLAHDLQAFLNGHTPKEETTVWQQHEAEMRRRIDNRKKRYPRPPMAEEA